MRSSKTGRKTSTVALTVWHVASPCWYQMLPISFSSIFVNKKSFNMARYRLTITTSFAHFRRKMDQLCVWTKIRTKHLLVLAVQCMRTGFLCPKCDNFVCLHSHQDQNELHLKRWFFAKIGIFCKSIAGPLSEALFKRIHNHIRSAEG